MEGPVARPERARKRSRFSQDFHQSTMVDPEPYQNRHSHLTAARGGSPTRIGKNTTLSHPTLPGLRNFSDPSFASLHPPLDLSLASYERGSSAATSRLEDTRAVPHYRGLGQVDNPSDVLETDFSSNFGLSFPNAIETDTYLWDEGLKASALDTCCASECTAQTCPSCLSCEQSCFLPCENPEECSSELCRDGSCACSPEPGFAGRVTPIFDHCEWVGNGENCSATVHSARQTVQHVNENHIKPQAQVTCEWDDCGISTDVHRLPNHLWRDHEPANYVCLWQHCEQAFSTHEELDAHFKLVHCNMGCHWAGCEMVTTSQAELQNHFSEQHLQFDLDHEFNLPASHEQPPSLAERSTSYSSETSVGIQLSSAESKSTGFSTAISESKAADQDQSGKADMKMCKWVTDEEHGIQCGLMFGDGNELQDHIRSAHIVTLDSKGLQCGWAGCKYKQATKDKSKLVRHVFTHSGYCFGVCKFCKQEFNEKSKLQQHEAAHLDDKRYVCRECNHSFSSQNALTNHQRIHTGEKPLICGMVVNGQKCGYTCSDPSNMSTHKKKHLPPQYVCSICEKAFCRSDALKRHLLVHEPKKASAKKRGLTDFG